MQKVTAINDVETGNGESVPEEMVSWHAESIQEVIRRLRASEKLRSTGLTSDEATVRLEQYGLNKMTEKVKENIWQKIWKQISNVLVCILVLVAVVSIARAIVEMTSDNPDKTIILTSWIQVALIILVITVNTIIGIVQEGSAEKAAEALKNMLSADARVIRDGVETMISAYDVVPGDVVFLSLGDRVPADMRLMEVANLACEEAALTGESVPIDKTIDAITIPDSINAEQIPLGDRHNMCFSATLVAQGSAVGVVIATGDSTQIGTINKLVSQVKKKKSNVLLQINQVSKLLAVLIGIATLCTFLVARLAAMQGWFEAISTALVCCVAMVPEGLEAIVTLTYAWAVTNMAKQNAIIRCLPAVETLGSVTVICSDKTGTLTQNIMSLTAFVTSNARYKFDVNSTERKPENFIRDNTYLTERAKLVLKKKKKQTPKKGVLDHQVADSSVDIESPAVDDTDVTLSKNITVIESDPTPVPHGQSPSQDFIKNALECGVLCSKCVLGQNGTREGAIGNPTELSILRAAYFSGIDIENSKTVCPVVAEVPFSSEYKFMATIHDANLPNDQLLVYAKGAPDRMVELCSTQAVAGNVDQLEPIDQNYWTEQIDILSSHGLRVLALCRSTVPKSSVSVGENLGPEFINGRPTKQWLSIVGLCAIMDPPRPECVQAINEAHVAGVRVAMITGDHKDTATAIGHMLGIVDEKYPGAVTGPEMDNMSDDELIEAVMANNVFARSSPANKIRIVNALQSQKQICSMTGDGVNDAPALKAADMGVAMGKEGTDVAREASEMILADDNFATIVTAVREGRVVWDNLRKVLLVNTPINNAQGMSVLFGLAFGMRVSPLSPIQVLYSNLICAITLGFVTAIEPAEDGIMNMPPRRIGKRLIGRYLLLRILIGTFTLTFLVVSSAFWIMSLNDPGVDIYAENCTAKYCLQDIRAITFNVLDFGAIGITLSARFAYNSSFHPRVFRNNKYCWYSVFTVAVLQVFLTYTPGINNVIFQMAPMDGVQWGITILFMFVIFSIMEIEKAIRRYLKFRKGKDTDDQEYNIFDDEHEGERKPGMKFLPITNFSLFKRTKSD